MALFMCSDLTTAWKWKEIVPGYDLGGKTRKKGLGGQQFN